MRARAALLLEEQRDEVKRMNQMMLYSKCVAIRSSLYPIPYYYLLFKAMLILAEQRDEVKRMIQVMLYSKCLIVWSAI